MNLAELPEDCVVSIISHTSPFDAARLACVCSAFKVAVESDSVWENFLPFDYKTICGNIPENRTKKQIVMVMADGVFLQHELQKYVLLRRSGGVCRMLSVAAMDVVWGQDNRFWRWEQSRSSCFGQVAHLLAVCWLEIRGNWSCSLPSGSYSAAWRLRVANPQGGRLHFLSWKCPVTFSVSIGDGQVLEKNLNMSEVPCKAFEEWFEFEVGGFTVHGDKQTVKQVDLHYRIRETDCTYWKGGLFLDCLRLWPTGCEEEVQPNRHTQAVTKILHRPGVF